MPVMREQADGVLLLTGPPCSGKTTTARLIAQTAKHGAHIEADSFFRFVRGGYLEPWLPESHPQNVIVMQPPRDQEHQEREQREAQVFDDIHREPRLCQRHLPDLLAGRSPASVGVGRRARASHGGLAGCRLSFYGIGKFGCCSTNWRRDTSPSAESGPPSGGTSASPDRGPCFERIAAADHRPLPLGSATPLGVRKPIDDRTLSTGSRTTGPRGQVPSQSPELYEQIGRSACASGLANLGIGSLVALPPLLPRRR